jgi:heme-degrading monooxygenase HmoA
MIARVWRGYTSAANADAYQSMLQPELLPGLNTKKGFRGSYLLRRSLGDEVEFITIILWESVDDIRAIAGDDYQTAVIPEDRKRVLSRWDDQAAHYEVTSAQASPASFL